MLDNCSVHHAKSVKSLAAALEIELIFLRPYSPQHNAIELFWSQVKLDYRKRLLAAYLADGKPPFIREIVVPALANVSLSSIQAFTRKALDKLFE